MLRVTPWRGRASATHAASRRRRCSRPSSTSGPRASSPCATSCATSASPCAMQPELRAAIVQDAADGRVLMLAWMNDEALGLTRKTGEAWFWSRSRQRLWKKGETSGNVLAVEELRDDCDGDALLLRVRPAGPACHTGATSCFAPALWRTVVERVRDRPEGSYVASLADAGVERAAQKLGEEAVEAAIAATAQAGRLVSEAADVLFHLYVLLAVAGVDVAEVEDELRRRAA